MLEIIVQPVHKENAGNVKGSILCVKGVEERIAMNVWNVSKTITVTGTTPISVNVQPARSVKGSAVNVVLRTANVLIVIVALMRCAALVNIPIVINVLLVLNAVIHCVLRVLLLYVKIVSSVNVVSVSVMIVYHQGVRVLLKGF